VFVISVVQTICVHRQLRLLFVGMDDRVPLFDSTTLVASGLVDFAIVGSMLNSLMSRSR